MILPFKLPDNKVPIQLGDDSFIYKDVYHPIEWMSGEPCRPRVETLVLNEEGTQVFVHKTDKGYRIPGGSIDADASYEKQAENETREEALLGVKDLKYSGITYNMPMDRNYLKKGGDGCIEYCWAINRVYVAKVNGTVDRSTIEEKDLDDDMAQKGKFYNIEDVDLKREHMEALINSGMLSIRTKANLQLRFDKTSYKAPKKFIFESGNDIGGELPKRYLFHGSIAKFDIFHPMSLDLGNCNQKPGWSTFCFDDYTLAKRFALMRAVQTHVQPIADKEPVYKCGWDMRNSRPYISKKVYEEVMGQLKGMAIYVYTIDATKLDVGIGNDERFPEFTFREDNVKYELRDEIFIDKESMLDDVTLLDGQSGDEFEKEQMENISDLNRGLYAYMLNRNYSEDSGIAKVVKAVSDGKLRPGDDVEEYIRSNNISIKDVTYFDRLQENLEITNPEITIFLGPNRMILTPNLISECNIHEAPEVLPADSEYGINDTLLYRYYLYEAEDLKIYDVGSRQGNVLGFVDITHTSINAEENKVYAVRVFVVPRARRLGLGDVLANYAIRYIISELDDGTSENDSSTPTMVMTTAAVTNIKGINKWIAKKGLLQWSPMKVGVESDYPVADRTLYTRVFSKAFPDSIKQYVSEGWHDGDFYFYHLVPKGSDVTKNGVVTLQWQWQHDKKAFKKNSDKYRDRLVGAWGIYPNRSPESLSDTEVLEGIKTFRGNEDGADRIYMFAYPPYNALGDKMRDVLKGKDLYCVNISSKEVKKYISTVYWGYRNSDGRNEELDKRWYADVSKEEYFKDYSEENGGLLFAPLNHIAVVPKNGCIPASCWSKVDIPDKMEDIMESCKNINEARKFVNDVRKLAAKYDADFFIVTNGASGYHNTGEPAVRNARDAQIKWEKENGFDPDEDWSGSIESVLMEEQANLTKLLLFRARLKTSGFDARDIFYWNIDKYQSTVEDAIKAQLDEISKFYEYANDITGESKFTRCELAMYTMWEDGSARCIGIVTVRIFESGNFDWKWAEQLASSQELIDAIIDEQKELIKHPPIYKEGINRAYEEFIDMTAETFCIEPVEESLEENRLLKPVYIILTYAATTFGKVITAWQHTKFSHAGLSFKSNMEKVYTFNMRTEVDESGKKVVKQGAYIENLDDYYNPSDNNDADICVMAMFVPKDTYTKMQENVENIFKSVDKTRYNIGNVINVVINRAVDTKDPMRMICSQFVDYILKSVDIDISYKSSNITTPKDFYEAAKSNNKIFLLFDGKKSKYNPKSIDRKIGYIRNSDKFPDIKIGNQLVTEGSISEDGISFVTYRRPEPIKSKRSKTSMMYDNSQHKYVIKLIDEIVLSMSDWDKYYIGVVDGKIYNEFRSIYTDVLLVDGKPAAYLMLYREKDEPTTGHINVGTHAAYRRKGYNKILVDRLKNNLPEGIDRLTWDYDKGNESSKAAAEHNGFKENDPKYSCKEWEYECAIQTVPVKEFTQIVNENVVFNVNNIMYNVEDFTSGKSNILLITGLSGSGKSTLADKMAKEHKAEVIELDVFEHCYGYADKDLHQAGDVFVEYLSAHRDVWDKLKKQQLTGKKIHAELYKFIMYTLAWCESRKNKRWVLEGVQIYSCLTAVEALQYPLIIMGTSATNSILQRFKRNVGGGNIDWSAELKNDFPELLEWYWSEEKHLSDFKKEVRIAEEATTMYGLVGLKLTGSLNLLLEADDKEEEDDEEKATDYTDDAEGTDGDRDETPNDYTNDVNDGGDDEGDNENTDDTSDTDNQTDGDGGTAEGEAEPASSEEESSSDDTATDYTNDADEGETGGDVTGGDDDMATDYTDDTDSGSDTGGDNTSEDTSDDTTSDDSSMGETDNQSVNNRVKNYSILKSFERLYRLANEMGNTIEPIIMEKPIQNKVLMQVKENIIELKNAIMRFIQFGVRNSYSYNLYYYETFLSALTITVKMLEKNKLFSDDVKKKINKIKEGLTK